MALPWCDGRLAPIFVRALTSLLVLLLFLAPTAARAQLNPGVPSTNAAIVSLRNGDILRGSILSASETTIELAHPLLGTLLLPQSAVRSVVINPPHEAEPASMSQSESDAPVQQPAADGPVDLAPPPSWSRRLDLGLNGSEGNSSSLSFRVGAGLERIAPDLETRVTGLYTRASDNGTVSQSRAELNARNDWLSTTSPWGFFLQGRVEFDEFQDWDWRTSAVLGPSYQLIENDRTSLRLRAGAGVAREFGGGRNNLIPEALAGFDFKHNLSDRQRLFLSTELLPSLDDLGEYRASNKLGYEMDITEDSKATIRLGIDHRYDSTAPSDRDSNDIDFFATLGVHF
jgi:putative salt-induced outer membrane protein YdiY